MRTYVFEAVSMAVAEGLDRTEDAHSDTRAPPHPPHVSWVVHRLTTHQLPTDLAQLNSMTDGYLKFFVIPYPG